jgi:hypothetical protein
VIGFPHHLLLALKVIYNLPQVIMNVCEK